MTTSRLKDLLAQRSSERTGRSWHVVQTMPRQEKSLARELERANIAIYLPTAEQRLHYMGRLAVNRVPVYPGYLFVLADASECRQCTAMGHAVAVLETLDCAGLLRVLRRIARAIESNLSKLPQKSEFLKITAEPGIARLARPIASHPIANV